MLAPKSGPRSTMIRLTHIAWEFRIGLELKWRLRKVCCNPFSADLPHPREKPVKPVTFQSSFGLLPQGGWRELIFVDLQTNVVRTSVLSKPKVEPGGTIHSAFPKIGCRRNPTGVNHGTTPHNPTSLRIEARLDRKTSSWQAWPLRKQHHHWLYRGCWLPCWPPHTWVGLVVPRVKGRDGERVVCTSGKGTGADGSSLIGPSQGSRGLSLLIGQRQRLCFARVAVWNKTSQQWTVRKKAQWGYGFCWVN